MIGEGRQLREEEVEEAVAYAAKILDRATAETSGPHVLGTACYIVVKMLCKDSGADPGEVFRAMARDFKKVD